MKTISTKTGREEQLVFISQRRCKRGQETNGGRGFDLCLGGFSQIPRSMKVISQIKSEKRCCRLFSSPLYPSYLFFFFIFTKKNLPHHHAYLLASIYQEVAGPGCRGALFFFELCWPESLLTLNFFMSLWILLILSTFFFWWKTFVRLKGAFLTGRLHVTLCYVGRSVSLALVGQAGQGRQAGQAGRAGREGR